MQLLLRVEHPSDRAIVVEARLDRDYLERVFKLVLICHKIRKTMYGAATVTIGSGCGPFVLLDSQQAVKWIIAKAGVKEWRAVQYVTIPNNLMLGSMGGCIVLAGMRSSTYPLILLCRLVRCWNCSRLGFSRTQGQHQTA